MRRRTRAERRHLTLKTQRRRIRRWREKSQVEMNKHTRGKARKSNFSCGCSLCKPWKWGLLKRSSKKERMKREGKETNLVIAPQEAIRFVEAIADEFIRKVLRLPWAGLTDSSSLSDFRDYTRYFPEDAIRPGSKPGYWVFYKKRSLRPTPGESLQDTHRRLQQIPLEEIEVKAHEKWRPGIIARTKRVFGVDITPVFDEPLVVIFQYIAARKTPSK